MKATHQGPRATGSMGMPPEMKEAVSRAESDRRTRTTQESDDGSAEHGQPTVEAGAASGIEAERELAKKRAETEIRLIEEEMGISITYDDIINYVKQGRLMKKVELVPGALSLTFQTLTGEDLEKVEEHMYAYRQKGSSTSNGIETEQALSNLTYGLAVYNGKNVAQIEDKTKVLKMLRQLGAHQLNKAVTWFNLFNKIVDHRLNDRDFLKKS